VNRPVIHSPLGIPYRNLGNISAAPPERSVALRCHVCRVCWIGCQDQHACPECGDISDWEAYLETQQDVLLATPTPAPVLPAGRNP
jgi:rRNA maturation endonuclease Nob1